MAALQGSRVAGRAAARGSTVRTVPSNGATMDWDDVRVFLAIARHGSLRAAGQVLGKLCEVFYAADASAEGK